MNGVLEGTSGIAWNSALVLSEVLRGTSGTTEASIDEFRVRNEARSEAEIAANLAVTIDPTSNGLTRYYRFDDADGVADETGKSADAPLPAGMSLLPSTSPVVDGAATAAALDAAGPLIASQALEDVAQTSTLNFIDASGVTGEVRSPEPVDTAAAAEDLDIREFGTEGESQATSGTQVEWANAAHNLDIIDDPLLL